jgi:predicted TIM-barrel fold metal-dependent hydrolase
VIVDDYAHYGILKYQPAEMVLDTMARAGVDRAVLCQHLGEYDNSYLVQVIGNRPEQFAAVLLVNPSKSGAAEKLRQWSDTGRLRVVQLLAEWLEP